MSRYLSIRGWIECDFKDIKRVNQIIESYKLKKEWIISDEDRSRLELYQSAWQVPKKEINWTAYVFYGADIKDVYYDYIKEQVVEIAKTNNDIVGFFICTDEEDDDEHIWKVENGQIRIENRIK